MLRWFRRRAERQEPGEPLPQFDASIDFDPAALGGVTAEQVRAAAAAIPGAGWVSVERHGGAQLEGGLEIRMFEPGSGVEAAGGAWSELRRQVEAAVCGLVVRPEAGWAEPVSLPTGFAEATAPFEAQLDTQFDARLSAQLDALAQLSALAEMQRAPVPAAAPAPAPVPAPAPAPVDETDAFRLGRLLTLVLPADAGGPAEAAIRRFGSFAAVLAAPEAELRRVPGLGTHCVAAIKLVHAAAVRHARAGLAGRPVLDDPQRLADYLSAALARERIEQFRILFLDADGMLQADEVQARGTVNHTPVYPREVVRRALALGASALILVHNHPSGDPEPSGEDIAMTKQVKQAAAVLGIGLRDHVIVGNGRWLSFRAEGLLD